MLFNWNPNRLFYGWWIVGACLLTNLYTGGVIFFGFTAVFEPIASEFGWSYTQISLAASLRGLEMGILAPVIGMLVDRWGPRKLMFGGAFISGIGLILLSRITSLGMFYGAFVLIAIGMSTCTSTVTITAVANWFRRKISIATGIMVSGFALGGLVVPLIAVLIDSLGWRTAMVSLGFGMWAICVPLSLIVRHKPEQYGYLPDGEASTAINAGENMKSTASHEKETGARQALSSRIFWLIALGAMYQAFAVNAVVTHVMPYLSSIGIGRSVSSLMASATPLASVLGRIGFGWLGDRHDKRWVAAIGFALMALGLIIFGIIPTVGTWLLVPFALIFGTGWGGVVPMVEGGLIREYFGRSHFGTILGFVFGVMMIGVIIGAPLAGWAYDEWGSYQGIWFVYAGCGAAALVAMLTIPPLDKTT
ncbi:MAG: MFS transporter [Chloroflexota bacterium]